MSTFHRASTVAAERLGDIAYLAPLPDGPITVLEGPALIVWDAIADDGLEDIVVRVAAATGEEPDAIREDIAGFVRTLIAARLVRPG